ncbi:MAG: hypothetical protein R3C59_18450 [Planctomycetaceae bacterium]
MQVRKSVNYGLNVALAVAAEPAYEVGPLMHPKLSNDVENLVTEAATGVVQVDGSHGRYFVMTEDAMRVLQYVQEGVEQAERGETSPWNSSEIIEKARLLHEQRSA